MVVTMNYIYVVYLSVSVFLFFIKLKHTPFKNNCVARCIFYMYVVVGSQAQQGLLCWHNYQKINCTMQS